MSLDLDAAAAALAPHEHRLGTAGISPAELVRVVAEAIEPGLRRELAAEEARRAAEPLQGARDELAGALERAELCAGLEASCREELDGARAELDELRRDLDGARAEAARYRDALHLIGDGRPAQAIVWQTLGEQR